MNSCESENGSNKCCRSGVAYVIAVLGALLIVAVLVFAMRHYTQPPPLGQARAIERAQKLGELRADETTALLSVGWIDQAKGIVRLPIEAAVQITLREWQNPAAARSNLIARVEKATYVPPPPPPKPSAFE